MVDLPSTNDFLFGVSPWAQMMFDTLWPIAVLGIGIFIGLFIIVFVVALIHNSIGSSHKFLKKFTDYH